MAQLFPAETVAREVADLEILHQHVASRQQPADQRLALGGGDVDRDRTLVAIGAEIVGALGRGAVTPLDVGRSPLARVVAGARSLDLHHVGAEIAQELGAGRTRQNPGEVQDPDPRQRLVHRRAPLQAVRRWLLRRLAGAGQAMAPKSPVSSLDIAGSWANLDAIRTDLVLIGLGGQDIVIRLSKLADYGIVIATHLARHPGRQHTAGDVAVATAVPAAMTSKILKLLTRAELLVSHRGAQGGYSLVQSPALVSVKAVVEALDGPIAITSCTEPTPGDCSILTLCPTRANWERINRAIRDSLDEVSLDEMAHAIPAAFLVRAEHLDAARQ